MDEIEKRNLALRFCTLSSKDQKSILAQLPDHVKNELVHSINVLEDKDFNSHSFTEFPINRELNSITYTNWNNFLIQVEMKQSESSLKLPSKLLQTIKDLNK